MGWLVVVLVVCVFGAASCEEVVGNASSDNTVETARELIEQGECWKEAINIVVFLKPTSKNFVINAIILFYCLLRFHIFLRG